jgi:hypothetical protein
MQTIQTDQIIADCQRQATADWLARSIRRQGESDTAVWYGEGWSAVLLLAGHDYQPRLSIFANAEGDGFLIARVDMPSYSLATDSTRRRACEAVARLISDLSSFAAQ